MTLENGYANDVEDCWQSIWNQLITLIKSMFVVSLFF